MKINYVTKFSVTDIHSLSGMNFYVAKALKDQGAEISYVDGLKDKSKYLFYLKKLFYKSIGSTYLIDRSIPILKDYAHQVSRKISADADVIFAPSSLPIAYLNTKKPKVFYTDATFASMIDYYSSFSNLCAETIKSGHAIEQQAIDSCSMAIYLSDWAAQSAINHYGISPDKVRVVPLGANVERTRSLVEIKDLIHMRSKACCRLLFLAVEWDRKGGDIALEVARLLNERGLNTELVIAGMKELPVHNLPSYVTSHGFISKATTEGKSKIYTLMEESHFLILPSRAEAFGTVIAEANAFGVPALATKTGGLTTTIREQYNGVTFALKDRAEEYADFILNTFNRRASYEELCLSSFNEYETRLNWKVSGRKLLELMKEL